MILIHSVSLADKSGDDNWVLLDREIRQIGQGESWRDLESTDLGHRSVTSVPPIGLD